MQFLYTYLILLIYFVIWFIISQFKKNNGLIDIAWGGGFVITAWSSMLLSKNFEFSQFILNGLVTIWGLRLVFYLGIRNWNKKEDFRYQAMRKKWKTKLKTKAFFKVFMTQAILCYIISAPILVTNFFSKQNQSIWSLLLIIVGVLVFLIGFIFEVVADNQLKKFKSNPNNKGKILTEGIWSVSRHPNYFGESTLWWGIGIISLSKLSAISILGLLGPIIITFLLIFVSGVPLLEKKYKDNLEFQKYTQKTSIFFPLPQKKTSQK